jgi:putative Mg2+ transporter-C (MgtC) family protein
MLTFEMFYAYWSGQVVTANILILLNLVGALLLGLLIGYERFYHGRAAGMRTYGLVCMASAALTIIGGYPNDWFGGNHAMTAVADPTRVIQGIVTGIGFLCAGVILHDGFNISGLTTAASLWASSVIGILVGVGFYPAAMVLALLCAGCMIWISKLEDHLPTRQAVAIRLTFEKNLVPQESRLLELAASRGYDIAGNTIQIRSHDGSQEWHFVAVARSRREMVPLSELAQEIAKFKGVNDFQLGYARN